MASRFGRQAPPTPSIIGLGDSLGLSGIRFVGHCRDIFMCETSIARFKSILKHGVLLASTAWAPQSFIELGSRSFTLKGVFLRAFSIVPCTVTFFFHWVASASWDIAGVLYIYVR